MAERIRAGRRSVEISNPHKELFPGAGVTKSDLAHYYRDVADAMLPHLRDRPLSLQRFPDGIDDDGFFQQQCPDHFPGWIRREELEKEGGTVEHVVVQRAADLVYLADQAAITLHAWNSRCDRPRHPDRMVFDLDPPGDDFAPVRRAARQLRELLGELDLPAYLLATGSRGLHVVVPLDRSAGYDEVRDFAYEVAAEAARRHPAELTTAQRKRERKGRLYLDVLRNAHGQQVVAPYTVRAREGAPVATPLDFDELGRPGVGPRRYHLGNLLRRLGQREDPWNSMGRHAHALGPARERLSALRGDDS